MSNKLRFVFVQLGFFYLGWSLGAFADIHFGPNFWYIVIPTIALVVTGMKWK